MQGPFGQRGLQFLIDDRGPTFVEHVDLGLDDVQGHHFMVLGQQDAVGQANVTGTATAIFMCRNLYRD